MIYVIVGTRPNFIKIASLVKELKISKVKFKIIHTGQHYDYKLSKQFFEELNIPEPDINLNVGSGSHAIQTANIMIKFERHLLIDYPSLVIVVGDVNSTLACALTAKKLNIKIAHIEAGLRSFDMTMPEEINRILTDHISDYLFISESSGVINLYREGLYEDREVHFVGNIMIDSIVNNFDKIKNVKNEEKDSYMVVTFHRPKNVDDKKDLLNVVKLLEKMQKQIKIIFPIHPRTFKVLKKYNLFERLYSKKNIKIIEPSGYITFLNLILNSKLVLTDSGGIQEECSFLGIPVITFRDSTERPVTVKKGTNVVVGRNSKKAYREFFKILKQNKKKEVKSR